MALAGDHVKVYMDDSGGTAREFDAGDITSVDLGQTYDQHDVTGFGDSVHNVVQGQLRSPVTLRGFLTTTTDVGTHTVIRDVFQQGKQVTLTVQVGQNTTPTTGDPEFEGEFYVTGYRPVIQTGGAVAFEATLMPAIGSGTGIPVWGSV